MNTINGTEGIRGRLAHAIALASMFTIFACSDATTQAPTIDVGTVSISGCHSNETFEVSQRDIEHTFKTTLGTLFVVNRLKAGGIAVENNETGCVYRVFSLPAEQFRFATKTEARAAIQDSDYARKLVRVRGDFVSRCLRTNEYQIELENLTRQGNSSMVELIGMDPALVEQSPCSVVATSRAIRLSLFSIGSNAVSADIYFLEDRVVHWRSDRQALRTSHQ